MTQIKVNANQGSDHLVNEFLFLSFTYRGRHRHAAPGPLPLPRTSSNDGRGWGGEKAGDVRTDGGRGGDGEDGEVVRVVSQLRQQWYHDLLQRLLAHANVTYVGR